LGEVRRAKNQWGNDLYIKRSRDSIHHKRNIETASDRKDRARIWPQLVPGSKQIDNAIFATVVVFVVAAIIAKALFWLFGW
jgi:hypothetical protein